VRAPAEADTADCSAAERRADRARRRNAGRPRAHEAELDAGLGSSSFTPDERFEHLREAIALTHFGRIERFEAHPCAAWIRVARSGRFEHLELRIA
jgi:hypothetical protein